MQVVVGIDIGGTKCAVSFAKQHSDDIEFLDKVRMKTETESFDRAMESFIRIIREKFSQNPDWQLMSIGISCGGLWMRKRADPVTSQSPEMGKGRCVYASEKRIRRTGNAAE